MKSQGLVIAAGAFAAAVAVAVGLVAGGRAVPPEGVANVVASETQAASEPVRDTAGEPVGTKVEANDTTDQAMAEEVSEVAASIFESDSVPEATATEETPSRSVSSTSSSTKVKPTIIERIIGTGGPTIYQESFSCPVVYYPGKMQTFFDEDDEGVFSFFYKEQDYVVFTFSYRELTDEEKAQYPEGKAPKRIYLSCDSVSGLPDEATLRQRWSFPYENGEAPAPGTWEFLGWSPNPNATQQWETISAPWAEKLFLDKMNQCVSEGGWAGSLFGEKSAFNLYPIVRQTLAVRFVLDGVGSGNYWTGVYSFPVTDKDGWFEISYVPDPEPALRMGYYFTGWSVTAGQQWQDKDYQLGTKTQVTEPLTLHACWIAVEDYDRFVEDKESRELQEFLDNWEKQHNSNSEGNGGQQQQPVEGEQQQPEQQPVEGEQQQPEQQPAEGEQQPK